MKNLTIEYQRFGDPTGVLRLSDRYIRTVGATELADEVPFDVPQENLTRAMALLDYGRLSRAEPGARDAAEKVLRGLAPHIERFLLRDGLPSGNADFVQLDVVTRALELAQLPFEIIEESRPHLIVTRRIRQPWPPPEVVEGDRPKVLFAWAEPPRMDVPHDRHRELLNEILRDLGGANAIVEVPHATRSDLSEFLDGKHGFTHVHLLVHGLAHAVSRQDDPLDLAQKAPSSAALALETADHKLDRCPPDELARWLSRGPKPQVVTIATCHSAEVDPIGSGGTIAHTLHAAGVPVVLASQLALTKDGSDFLVRVFLKQVIDGEDPRKALRLCRDGLRADKDTTYYDRVALVGYVHLDPHLEERLIERRFRVELARLKAISAEARARVARAVESLASGNELADQKRDEAEIRSRFEDVRSRLAKLAPNRTLSKAQREELLGLHASSLKREAEAAWSLGRVLTGDFAKDWQERSRGALREATEAYGRAAKVSRDHHWTWVQWLVLLAVQNGRGLQERATDWEIATVASRDAAERETPTDADGKERRAIAEDSVWGWGSLSELYLLAPLVGRPDAIAEAKECLDNVVRGSRDLNKRDAIDATRDQLARYQTWWGEDPTWQLPKEIIAAAAELHDYLCAIADKAD